MTYCLFDVSFRFEISGSGRNDHNKDSPTLEINLLKLTLSTCLLIAVGFVACHVCVCFSYIIYVSCPDADILFGYACYFLIFISTKFFLFELDEHKLYKTDSLSLWFVCRKFVKMSPYSKNVI